ncbi:MAG: nucleotide exchange factor GrpE [Anaerolineaceae bacterium]
MNDEKKKRSDKFTPSPEYLEHDRAGYAKNVSKPHKETAVHESADLLIEIASLKEELEKSNAKADEFSDGWQRERADFQNYKRRVERDQIMQAQEINGRIIKRFLAVQDDLDRALKNRPTGSEAATWSEGIELVNRKLASILESENVKIIDAENQQFDPNFHEALSHEESSDHESGQIIEVIQQGYTLGDRVLRPALVRVAR